MANNATRPSPIEQPYLIVKKSLLRRCLNRVLNIIVRLSPGSTNFRPMLHRARGVKVGKEVFIGDEVYLDNEYPECIEIQDQVQISTRAVILAHTRGPGKIIIEREAFIGPHATITCPAGRTLKIGRGAVVSAGCVVSRSVPPGMVLTPAPLRALGYAAVSLPTAHTMEEFLSGLRLTKAPAGAPRSNELRPGAGNVPEGQL